MGKWKGREQPKPTERFVKYKIEIYIKAPLGKRKKSVGYVTSLLCDTKFLNLDFSKHIFAEDILAWDGPEKKYTLFCFVLTLSVSCWDSNEDGMKRAKYSDYTRKHHLIVIKKKIQIMQQERHLVEWFIQLSR